MIVRCVLALISFTLGLAIFILTHRGPLPAPTIDNVERDMAFDDAYRAAGNASWCSFAIAICGVAQIIWEILQIAGPNR